MATDMEFLRKGEVLYVVIGRNPWDQPITRRATYAEKRHYEEDVALAQLIDQGYPLSHVRLLQDCEPPEGASGGVVKVIPEQGIFSGDV